MDSDINVSAPRVGPWLLGWFLTDANKDGVLGDLAEEFVLRSRLQSAPNATRWYWRQVLRSLPRLFWSAFRRGEWRGALGAAISAYVFIMFIEAMILMPLSQVLALSGLLRWIVEVPVGLSAMTLGGFLAAWMRRGAAGTLAVLSVIMVIVLMITMGDASPRWFQITFLFLGPIAVLTGGALLRRRQASTNRPTS